MAIWLGETYVAELQPGMEDFKISGLRIALNTCVLDALNLCVPLSFICSKSFLCTSLNTRCPTISILSDLAMIYKNTDMIAELTKKGKGMAQLADFFKSCAIMTLCVSTCTVL